MKTKRGRERGVSIIGARQNRTTLVNNIADRSEYAMVLGLGRQELRKNKYM